MFDVAAATAGTLVGSVAAAASRRRIVQNRHQLLFALVEFFVDLKVLKQYVNICGNPTNVNVVLVFPFLLTPAHHDDAELGIREGETLARHQAVVVDTREEL